jgi:hypothetical protein
VKLLAGLLLGAVLVGAGAVLGARAFPKTDVRVETTTRVSTVAAPGLPAAVARTHARLLAAAESGSYDELEPLVTSHLNYSFGGPFDGGAIAYWKHLEATSAERPLATLAKILRMPYVLDHGIYAWPFAYAAQEELTAHERALLAPVASKALLDEIPTSGYLGWRAGISPAGDWVFYISGD